MPSGVSGDIRARCDRTPDPADVLADVTTEPGGRFLVGSNARRVVLGLVTIAAWGAAAWSWVLLYLRVPRGQLGFDLLTTWRAEKLFEIGAKPYSVGSFVYPPSCLLLLRPLALLSAHQLVVGALFAAVAVAWLAVMLTAAALGMRWWGLTAALTILLLSFTGAMRGELPLENVSILEFLALALFFLLALQDHWLAAAAVFGVALAVKPMLLPVYAIFILARRWKALGVAVGLPAALNLIAFGVVAAPGEILSKLPSLLDRTGVVVIYNSAWVDVARNLGLPEAATILLRVFAALLAALAAWLAWRRLEDRRLRLVTSSSALLIGAFTAGTLSEYHFMLTLVPLAMTAVIPGSPMRFPLAWLGTAWSMDVFQFPVLGLGRIASDSALRAIGMSLLILTIAAMLAARRPSSTGATARSSSLTPATAVGVVPP